jgi:hypothetical protein
MEILLVTTAVVMGFFLMRLANPAGGLGPRWAAFLLELALGAGFGIAVVSLLFFALLLIHSASLAVMITVEIVLLLTSAGFLFSRQKRKSPEQPVSPHVDFRWTKMLGGSLAVSALAAAAAIAKTAQDNRFGTWDAWNIWNLRAKYLAGPGDTWTYSFSKLLNYFSHPDYPLLLSGFIAHLWKFSGGEPATLAPIVTGAIFTASVAALLIAALVLMRSASSAFLAGLILICTTSFLGEATSQYSDVPLGFYYLATLLLLYFSLNSTGARRASLAALGGAFASFGTWTKNEGLFFLALSFVCYGFFSLRRKNAGDVKAPWCYPLLGAAPGLLVVSYFRLFLALPGDMGVQSLVQMLHKFTQVSRYWIIAKALVARAMEMGNWWSHPILLLVILAIALRFSVDERQKNALIFGWLSLILLFLAYCGFYLVTPLDLRFHLSTSLSRLYIQMWPSFLFMVFLTLGRPEEAPRLSENESQSEDVLVVE